jgi:hypothetical protein
MRSFYLFAVVAVLSAGVSFGGDDGTQSVLVAAQPTPAAAPVVVAAAPVVVETAAPACANGTCGKQPQLLCVDGKCGSKLYSVDSQESCQHRHRLFGGTVTRKSTRTVVKPVRR